jgi:hypothetical protein
MQEGHLALLAVPTSDDREVRVRIAAVGAGGEGVFKLCGEGEDCRVGMEGKGRGLVGQRRGCRKGRTVTRSRFVFFVHQRALLPALADGLIHLHTEAPIALGWLRSTRPLKALSDEVVRGQPASRRGLEREGGSEELRAESGGEVDQSGTVVGLRVRGGGSGVLGNRRAVVLR